MAVLRTGTQTEVCGVLGLRSRRFWGYHADSESDFCYADMPSKTEEGYLMDIRVTSNKIGYYFGSPVRYTQEQLKALDAEGKIKWTQFDTTSLLTFDVISYEEYNGSWYYYAKATNEVGTRYVSTPNIIIDADPAVALEYPSGKELTGKYRQTESGTYWGDLQFTVVDESEFTVKDGSTPLEPDENGVYTIKADMDEGIKHEIVIMDAGNNRTAYINEIRMNTLDRRDNPSALNLPNGANLEESLPKTVRILTARDSSMFTNIPVIWEIPETYEQASKREQSFTVNGTLDLSGTDIVLHPDKTELGKAQISVTIAGAPRYTLTIADSANGSITVVNATEIAEDGKPLFFKDELVMLSIAPDEGYMLSALSVNGIPATVAVGDDTYTFAQPEGDVTITAAFEKRNDHTVTFDANGGSEPEDLPEEVTTAMPDKKVLHGSEYYLPECEFIAPEGKQFKAWQIDGTEYPVNAPVTVTADITVKALWKDAPPAPVEYTVTVTTEGNGTASASSTSATAGTEITLTATPNEGYSFKEWQVMRGNVTIKDDKFTMPDSDVEIKAIFEEGAPAEYTVRFKANGGGGTMADVTGVSGSYTLPSCGFTEPEGKQFKGWSTSADGSVISGTTYEVSSDTTFYAIWESKEYSIIVTDGKATIGAGSEISKAAQGTTITLTANAAPDGKVFDKWVVESGNTTLEDANSETTTFIMPDSEVSVKATYTIPHTHTYDQEIQKPETLKSAADCTNDAVYFKSCSCGEISTTETFTAAGTQLGHAWASDWSKDTDNHWKECSRCHEKKDEAAHDYGSDNICDTCGYDKTVPHTHNLTLVPAKAPTCTEKGNTAYYTCDGCDKWFEDATGASEITDKTSVILAATGHSASDWKSDNTDHWKECTVVGCGVIIEGSKAAHTAGEWIIDTPATATTSGSKHKECTVCGYTMATETIPATGGGEHTHSYGSEWKNDADNHWHECSCGDKKDTAAHTAGEWIIDTPATATTDGSKHKECTVCKRVLETGTIPAIGSGEHTHNYSSDWKSDSINHWKECSCGDKADVAAHSFKWVVDKEATATKKGSKLEECKVCGYQRPAVEIPATGTPTEPTDPTKPTNPSKPDDTTKPGSTNGSEKSPQTGDNSNMMLWFAVLFVSGFGVLGTVIYGKKRKNKLNNSATDL